MLRSHYSFECCAVTTVRLSYYAQRLPAITVASAKSNALTCFALLWLTGLGVQRVGFQSGSLTELWEGGLQPQAWLLVLWAALGPGALAAFLQTQVSKQLNPLLRIYLMFECTTTTRLF